MNKKAIKVKDINLGELKSFLDWGDMVIIAEKTGYTPNYVRMVLNPNNKRSNLTIIREAIKMVENQGYVEINSELANSLTG